MGRLFISALHKSSGKTMISVGVAAALRARGHVVQTFKKGPDYIDPMWLAHASGRACFNLDFNTQEPAEIVAAVARKSQGADVALIEGNKGLHDGVATDGRDSSAALARLTQAPVVLVVDTLGMTRGVAPMLMGFRAFDPAVRIAGVILNKVGAARQEAKLRQAIETYCDLPVLGVIGRDAAPAVEERHLGLAPPAECAKLEVIIAHLADVVDKGVDLDRLLAAADGAPLPQAAPLPAAAPADIVVAVARDAAFGFYYADDLEALERAGAKLVFFDTLRDRRLPDCDGLLIGGGFPETQAAALAANASLRADIARALAAGLPAYAECGGLMYLCRSLSWRGRTHEMVGAVAADAVMRDRPQGRGLVVVEETADAPWPAGGGPLPAHEFHYAALENVDPRTRFAWRVTRGHGIDGAHDGIVAGNLLAGFTHFRDTSRNGWAQRFAAFVRARRRASRAA
ncbi:MAG TPA: cobyrinate a,c-diamide synthase [Rhodoblastus sp.]|nr:cobyrinate a,c-diamide synthase [Rhodoblastus sp.]